MLVLEKLDLDAMGNFLLSVRFETIGHTIQQHFHISEPERGVEAPPEAGFRAHLHPYHPEVGPPRQSQPRPQQVPPLLRVCQRKIHPSLPAVQ
jgi:hypothetical protein